MGLMAHLAQVLPPPRDEESREQDERIKSLENSIRAAQTYSDIALNTSPQSHFVALRHPEVLFLHLTAHQEFVSHELSVHCFQPM